jgi:hypothetical protein
VAASADKTVMESVIEQAARERAERAVTLRDQGRTDEARALLSQNAAEMRSYLSANPASPLADLSMQYNGMLMMLSKPSEWNEQRKVLRQMDSRGTKAGARY